MIEFHGKPFLEYLLEMVRDQGFQRVLLLLGYLPEPVQAYFGDGSRFGISIEYSVTDEANDTGRRLKLAAGKLDSKFLLMYCDNYWPMQFEAMWQQYQTSQASALVTVYQNSDGYTRDNLRVDDQGFVVEYDKSRSAPGLSGVDIGFMIFQNSVIESLPEDNISFEASVYPQLVADRQLQAYVTEHRYYSVGSHERLPITEEFLARRPVVLVDRDGVLNRKMPRGRYVRSWDEWEWALGAKEALRLLNQADYRVIIISNQSGIARGVMTEEALTGIHMKMKAEVREAGGEIEAIYYCPHGWDDGCACRKPKPGMLLQAQKEHHLDLSMTYFIGDDERDGQAADAAGCPWIHVTDDSQLLEITRNLLGHISHDSRRTQCQTASC
jgi:D-glycero-D-manno-heptose 1,7-bisphosphate phosphatase